MYDNLNKFDFFLENLQKYEYIIIQMHDYPDYDALASAYCVQQILYEKNYRQNYIILVYAGNLHNLGMRDLIAHYDMKLVHVADVPTVYADAALILVDCISENSNVTLYNTHIKAMFDHHMQCGNIAHSVFYDIRPEVGACSSIIFEYMQKYAITINRKRASLLYLGLMLDTNHMTRKVSNVDLQMFYVIYPYIEHDFINNILTKSLSIYYLPSFSYALEHYTMHRNLCFVDLKDGSNLEISAIIANFFLSLKEVDFVVTILCCKTQIRISTRSNILAKSAEVITVRVLKQFGGNGGGHHHQAGGVIDVCDIALRTNIRMQIEAQFITEFSNYT